METYVVHYLKPKYVRDLRVFPKMVKRVDIPITHTIVSQVEASDLEEVFWKMQGENWSPNGEAMDLIESLGLAHTSMSVGDVVTWDNDEGRQVAVVDNMGFIRL